MFELSTPYYPIPGSRPEGTFGAIVEMLLKARLQLQLEQNVRQYEEDVNTYLGGVLVSYIDPEYLTAVSEFLSKYDLDVHQLVLRAGADRAQIYWIYKANADDLLLTLGIFRQLGRQPRPEMDRIRRYYQCASECQKRIYGKSTAVAEIQAKLAEDTGRYVSILAQARKEYLHFVQQVGADQLKEFSRQVEQELPVLAKRDELLDAYAAWMRQPADLSVRERLRLLAEELRRMDPEFKPEQILSKLGPPAAG